MIGRRLLEGCNPEKRLIRFIDAQLLLELGLKEHPIEGAAIERVGLGEADLDLEIDLLAGQLLGQFPFAIMRVQRPAALLLGGGDYFAAIARNALIAF